MGLSNPKQFMPHTLRHMLGTHLANDPNVSLKECLSTMRHSSAAANLNYQANNTKSEENRLIALGFVPPEEEECSRSSSVTVKAICQKRSSFQTPCDISMPELQSLLNIHSLTHLQYSSNLAEICLFTRRMTIVAIILHLRTFKICIRRLLLKMQLTS